MVYTNKNFSEQTITELPEQDSLQAFNMLYDKYAAAIFGFISRITGGKDAENILQQTFVEVWKSRKTLLGANEAIFIQIFRIARKFAIESVRNSYDPENRNILYLVYSTETENFLTERNKTKMIEEPARSALQLMYFKCYTLEEAAIKLNISTETLSMKVKHAVEKLNATIIA